MNSDTNDDSVEFFKELYYGGGIPVYIIKNIDLINKDIFCMIDKKYCLKRKDIFKADKLLLFELFIIIDDQIEIN